MENEEQISDLLERILISVKNTENTDYINEKKNEQSTFDFANNNGFDTEKKKSIISEENKMSTAPPSTNTGSTSPPTTADTSNAAATPPATATPTQPPSNAQSQPQKPIGNLFLI